MTTEKKVLDEQKDKAVLEEWKAKAESIQSVNSLFSFIESLTHDYEHDYGTVVHAISSAMYATMQVINRSPTGGITGFQAGCVMHQLIPMLTSFKAPYRILDYNNMLYPQYEYTFEKTISESTWKYLQKKANENLKSGKTAHNEVISHWHSISIGNVPFGYQIVED